MKTNMDRITGMCGAMLGVAFTLHWQDVFQTAVLAAIGAVVGFFTTTVLKFLKKRYGHK